MPRADLSLKPLRAATPTGKELVMLRTVLLLALVPVLAATLAACGPAKPPLLRIGVEARSDANPDRRGRPSPVLVRVYELKSLSVFNGADYFALNEQDDQVLGKDLVAREEFALRPGETRVLERALQPDTRFLGVVAGFRDLEKAQWRAAYALPAKRKKRVTVEVILEGKSIHVAQADGMAADQAHK
jgi:type VI secretion system protein VasD